MRPETRHSIILVIGTGLTALLSITYIVYAGRALGPQRYGDFSAIIAMVYLCGSAMGPINETVAKFTARFSATGAWGNVRWLLLSATRRVTLYGTAALALGLLVSPLIKTVLRLESLPPVWVGLVMVYILLFTAVARGVLRGSQRFVSFSVNTVTEAAIRWGLGLGFLAWTLSTTSALLAYAIALFVIAVVSYLQVSRLWGRRPAVPDDGRLVRQFVIPVLVFSLCKAGFEHIDMLMVKHYFPDRIEAGLYGASLSLSRVVGAVATPFGTMMIPILVSLYERGERLTGTFLRLCAYFLLLISGPMVAILLWPDWIMEFCFESEFAAAAPILGPMCFGRVGVYLGTMIGLLCLATNRFAFLYIYVVGLLLQVAAISVWHDSLATVVRAVAVTPWLTAVVLAIWVIRPKTPRSSLPSDARNG